MSLTPSVSVETHSGGTRFLQHLPILSILALALLLRIIGVNFGLPDLYHADEPIVVNHALAFGGGDLNPHFFKIPPLVSYLLFGLYGVYFLVGSVFGIFQSTDDFLILFLRDPTSFYVLGRIVFGVLMGVATVYGLYRFGRRFFSYEHGLISAFFLAVCFLHVRDSHYIYVDIPLLLVMVLSFFPLLKIRERGSKKDYLLFGALFGTAVATKYNGVFLVFPFLVAHLKGRAPMTWALSGLVVSVVTFSVLNPFWLIDFRFVIKELLTQSGSETSLGFLHHFHYSLKGGMGAPLLYLSLAGLILSFFSHDIRRGVIATFVFTYFLVLGLFSQPYERYVLPLIPFLCMLAADALIQAGEKIRLFRKWGAVFAVLLAAPSIAKAAVSDYLFVQKDVRTEAREWIEGNLPTNSKIAIDIPFYGPRIKANLKQIVEKKAELSNASFSQVQQRRLDLMALEAEKKPEGRCELLFLADRPDEERFLFSKPTVPYDLSSLRKLGIDYVVVAQIDPTARRDFYEEVQRQGQLVAEFNPYREGRIEESTAPLALTGGPFSWRDLASRRANGKLIRVYRLK